MNKKIYIGLLTSSLLLTNSNAISGMTGAEYNIFKTTTDQAQWGVESIFNETLSEFELTNTILSGQIGLNSNKTYEQVMGKVGELGGGYGEEISGIMDSCFGMELPSFSKSLGLDGLSFCGIGDVQDIVKKAMKDKSGSIEGKDKENVVERKENPKGQPIDPKKDSSKVNCDDKLNESCTEDVILPIIKEEVKNGVSTSGNSTSLAVKRVAVNNVVAGGEICTENELIDGTTKAYSCKKEVIDDIVEYSSDKDGLMYNTSKLMDAKNEDNIRVNMIENNEKKIEETTARINEARDIRDEYNMRFFPDTMVYRDVANMGGNSFYERNKDSLNQFTTKFVTPKIEKSGKESTFSVQFDDLSTYSKGLETALDNGLEDLNTSVITNNGGLTTFNNAYLGYRTMNKVMADNIFTIAEDGTESENGSIGRETAVINGLKGLSYQTMLVTQTLNNLASMQYNIGIKEFSKVSSDNDEIKYQLSQMQQQNLLMVNALRDISTTLKDISIKLDKPPVIIQK